MRTKLIIACFIIAGALFCYWRINYLSEQNTLLKAENNELKTQWEKERKANVEASKRIQELNKIIKENPASANYGASAIDGALLDELRKQYLSKRD